MLNRSRVACSSALLVVAVSGTAFGDCTQTPCGYANDCSIILHDIQEIGAQSDINLLLNVTGGEITHATGDGALEAFKWSEVFGSCPPANDPDYLPNCCIDCSFFGCVNGFQRASGEGVDLLSLNPLNLDVYVDHVRGSVFATASTSGAQLVVSAAVGHGAQHFGVENPDHGPFYLAGSSDLGVFVVTEYVVEPTGGSHGVTLTVGDVSVGGGSRHVDYYGRGGCPQCSFPGPGSDWTSPPLIGGIYGTSVRVQAWDALGAVLADQVIAGGADISANAAFGEGFVTTVSNASFDLETCVPLCAYGDEQGSAFSGAYSGTSPINLGAATRVRLTVSAGSTHEVYPPTYTSGEGDFDADLLPGGYGSAGASGSGVAGDADLDGLVNQFDRDVLAAAIAGGTVQFGDPEYIVFLDLDGDFDLDTADLALFDSMFCPCSYEGEIQYRIVGALAADIGCGADPLGTTAPVTVDTDNEAVVLTVQVMHTGNPDWDGIFSAGGTLRTNEDCVLGDLVPHTWFYNACTSTLVYELWSPFANGTADAVGVAAVDDETRFLEIRETYGQQSTSSLPTAQASGTWQNLCSAKYTIEELSCRNDTVRDGRIRVDFEDLVGASGRQGRPFILNGSTVELVPATEYTVRDADPFYIVMDQNACSNLTCSCELVLDSVVDVFDLLAYLELWFIEDPAAERTADNPVDIDVFDLLDFLDCWFGGSSGLPCDFPTCD